MSMMHQTKFHFTKKQVGVMLDAIETHAKQHKGKEAHMIRQIAKSLDLQTRRIERNGVSLSGGEEE